MIIDEKGLAELRNMAGKVKDDADRLYWAAKLEETFPAFAYTIEFLWKECYELGLRLEGYRKLNRVVADDLKRMSKLEDVTRAAARALPVTQCDGPEHEGCRACDLKQALDALEVNHDP
jgi:hypothetical protein